MSEQKAPYAHQIVLTDMTVCITSQALGLAVDFCRGTTHFTIQLSPTDFLRFAAWLNDQCPSRPAPKEG